MDGLQTVVQDGIEYVIGSHPFFFLCTSVSWKEDDKTFRFYVGNSTRFEPDKWRAGVNAMPHWSEQAHYVGEGLDIILNGKQGKKQEEILAIRPNFVQYGERGIICCVHNNYSARQDLSGVGYATYDDVLRGFISPADDAQKVAEALDVFSAKAAQAKAVLSSIQTQAEHRRTHPPLEAYLR